MSERVEVTVRNHIAVVHLNRPEKHNALDHASFEALIETGESIAANPLVRAVILTGAGESFCAGIDRSVFEGDGATGLAELMKPQGGHSANFFQRAALVWRDLPVPVIAAIKGVAYGAGLQIALAADVRLSTAAARFSIMEIRWGIIPDMGITVSLRHVAPLDQVRSLAYTGRVIDGNEALRHSLVTEICDDPLASAKVLAGEIAQRSPDAVRALKSLLNVSLQAPEDVALRREAELQGCLLGSLNQREAVAANLQKRDPCFADSRGGPDHGASAPGQKGPAEKD